MPDTIKQGELAHRVVRLRKGEPLYLLGDPVTALFAIRVGTVKTHVATEDGRTQVVGFHFPGEMVGLDSIGRRRYASYATALEDTKVCMIPMDALRALAASTPALASRVFLALDRQAQRTRGLQTLLALMTAEERLVTFLLWISEGLSARGFSSSEFILRMSREEIGSYIGLTLETVSRQFSRLAECGLIRVKHRSVALVDKAGLRAIAARPAISAVPPGPGSRRAAQRAQAQGAGALVPAKAWTAPTLPQSAAGARHAEVKMNPFAWEAGNGQQ
ncbi:cyclic nucleotide-binding domain-containing protein [Cupriavidus sp. WKF15]|uniref:cyclic nucleotide-binding domain-containing protein n=1 Tax=Cupriavidus sp. WKF15 TaxID=3032282 RepID=UPI0031FEB5D8